MTKRMFLAAFVLLAPWYAFGDGGCKDGQALQWKNNILKAIPNATVRVCAYSATPTVPCSSPSTLYASSDLAVSVPNPATADKQGNYSFCAPSGRYTYQVTNPQDGQVYTQAEVVIPPSNKENYIDAESYGAQGDGIADDAAAINAAIAAGVPSCKDVFLPAGTYNVSTPITLLPCSGYQLGGMVGIRGAGIKATIIKKTTNTVGTYAAKQAPQRAAGFNDVFNVDSIITIAHGDDSHSYFATLSDFTLDGEATLPNFAAIYAPRTAHLVIKRVHGQDTQYGFYTYDSWMTDFDAVRFDNVDTGLAWKDDGSDQSTGTSVHLSNVEVRTAATSCYFISRLSYTSFDNTGCDLFNAVAQADKQPPLSAGYVFEKSEGMVLNGMGAESSYGSMFSAVLGSTVTINGAKTFDMHQLTSAANVAYLHIDNAKVTINSSTFQSLQGSGNFFNLVLQNGGVLILNNTALPTGGNGFISYGGGSVLIESNLNGVKVTSATGVGQFNTSGQGIFSGGIQLTSTADVLTWFKKTTHAGLDLASVASGACTAEQAETMIGVLSGDHCTVDSSANPLPAGTFFTCKTAGGNTVKWQYCNLSGSPVDLTSLDFTVRVIR